MKTRILLLFVAITLGSSVMAATIKVTSNEPIGTGSLKEAVAAATDGDIIVFEFQALNNDILLDDEIDMKNITINGINTVNGLKVVLKQTVSGKKVFDLAAGVSASISNLIFDGSAGSSYPNITAVVGSTLNIDNCIFRNINSGTNNGSAARLQGVANVTNCLFENNTCSGSYGGPAICIYNAADITVDNCSFVGNSSTGAPNRGGGAIVVRGTVDAPVNVKIMNSTFVNNTSTNTGGAILASVQSSGDRPINLTVVNCTFAGNQGDGAISTLVTVKGTVKVYLVNSIVVNNVNAAGSEYSDLLETLGATADPTASVLIEPHNVIDSVASETIVTADRNCIKVADPSTADIFKELETFATDKHRPKLSNTNGQSVAMISSSSIAKNAGVSILPGYTIPSLDQLGAIRPAIPAIGAVEFKDLSSGVPATISGNKITLKVSNREISVSGITKPTTIEVYSLMGSLLKKSVVSNNGTISMQGFQDNIFILKIEDQSFKVFLR
jgi:hypothetical protein